MPAGLRRIVGRGDLHFVTFSCYQRRTLLDSAAARNLTIEVLGEIRAEFGFGLVGYVVMPSHLHMLISECGGFGSFEAIQELKRRVSARMRSGAEEGTHRRFWLRRYYDFNVYSRAKMREKLFYMHGNPVNGKLVSHPGDWPWSSWSFYYRGSGLLAMDAWE
jgi:putative transposase